MLSGAETYNLLIYNTAHSSTTLRITLKTIFLDTSFTMPIFYNNIFVMSFFGGSDHPIDIPIFQVICHAL